MPYKNEYLKKLTTVENALDSIKDGDYVFLASASCEPVTFIQNFHHLHGKRSGIILQNNMVRCSAEMFNEKYRDLYTIESMFFAPTYRKMQKWGMASYMPSHLRYNETDALYRLKRDGQPINVAVLAVSPMDKHGYFTTGSLAGFVQGYLRYADRVIVEVNEACPRTFGDTLVHISQVDMIYEAAEHTLIYMDKKEPNEVERTIGK